MKVVEIWKPVRGYEGILEVSNYGNIKTLERIVDSGAVIRKVGGKILKVRSEIGGKPINSQVQFTYDAKVRHLTIARVVYESFNNIDLDNKKVIVYKDGDRSNNRLENIKIITRRNVPQVKVTKSGITGVIECSNITGYYSALIWFQGKQINLHNSRNKEECRKIYELAKAMIDEYDKLKAGILSNSRLNNKLIVKSIPIA